MMMMMMMHYERRGIRSYGIVIVVSKDCVDVMRRW